ncbi:MAG TPA: FG-GAP-like repeat-containing protein [Lentimicrobium sp.]|nr:FG-GAP-like repeat-containing protein [Lentimicrobium sp.]
MNKRSVLFFIIFFISFAIHAQPFTGNLTLFQGISRGAVVFADFDNDNDLDLFISGQDASYNEFAGIYRNDNGTFIYAGGGITGMYNCSAAAADYDLDGWMDLVMTGQDYDGNITRLYRNNGNGTFSEVQAGLYNAGANGDLAWADVNSDGYPDLVISGNWLTRLYLNNGDGTFTHTPSGLQGMNSPSLDWGDFDNDGDPDLLMVGDAGSVGETYIYINHQGTFERLDAQIEGAVGGMARWGDSDNDGYLDLLITGKDATLVPVSYVYRNNGDMTFSFANAGLIGTALGPANWIDFDNDGDLDVMLAGENAGCGNSSTRLYSNNGAGSFSEIQAGLGFVERAASAWGDFDNDGDQDLVLSGIAASPLTWLYRNDLRSAPFQPNTPPSVPGNIYTYVSGNYAVISWSKSTDNQSPQEAITYNVMMGTQPGNSNVVSPLADPFSGRRYVTAPGNAGQNDFMIFRHLEPGTYYFSVQAIDQAFAGSEFSEEESFMVLPTGTVSLPVNSMKTFFSGDRLHIERTEGGTAIADVFFLTGQLAASAIIEGNSASVSLSALRPGIYIIRITGKSAISTGKAAKY